MSSEWPQRRRFPFADPQPLATLERAWNFSGERLQKLGQQLEGWPVPNEIACVAVSGSLARMEGHAGSDLDLMIVLDDREAIITTERAEQIFLTTWMQLDQASIDQPLKPPMAGGVFSRCVLWSTLIDPSVRGIVNEDVTSFGQRMQLLLDAQPIFQHKNFQRLQKELLHWYSEFRVSQMFGEPGPFHWLWQDVQRYWRSLRSRACWLHEDDFSKSITVNTKLRSSRMLLIAGFLLAIQNSQQTQSNTTNAIDTLCDSLMLTPMERIAAALQSSQDQQSLLLAYQTAWQFISRIDPLTSDVPDEVKSSLEVFRKKIAGIATNGVLDWVL